ncbi:hypothetical protein QFC22_006314 [Naganishia vaughanmartiniae]|uniref:Uncharacterized protein n=1 Tax=Naganishia vaughanmartiniae TaxID=1424756 RepID=A0ACC2WM46_9TREE|nr:hypothetical protein QFC22_006314 [Naganishia vaughanmartiniae]
MAAFGSTKKAATTPETSPFIEVTPPAPSDNSSDESEVEPEPLIVFFDDPEDSDYVYDEADWDEEDVSRNVQAMKQLKALNLEWKAVAKSHEEDDMDEDEDETEEVEGVSPEDAGLSQLESTVVMAWIQTQGGIDAAGGGAELTLELEMDDLAEKNPEEEGEEEDMEGVEQAEMADMNTLSWKVSVATVFPMWRKTESWSYYAEQEDEAALNVFSRNTNVTDSVAIVIEEVTPNEPSLPTLASPSKNISDAVKLIGHTIEKGKRASANLHVAETAPLNSYDLKMFLLLRA